MAQYTERLPDWTLKIFPVLTGHLSLAEFENWLYLPRSESYFPSEVYQALISFNYHSKLSNFITELQDILTFEHREVISEIAAFLQCPNTYLNWNKFSLLPVSEELLQMIWQDIWRIFPDDDLYWYDRLERNKEKLRDEIILTKYLSYVVFFLQSYDKNYLLMDKEELSTIYHMFLMNQ